MLNVITIVAPVFAIVATGYLAVRLRLYPVSEVGGLIRFVNNFAAPFLLFRAMLEVDFSTALNPAMVSAFYIAAFAIFGLAIFIARRLFAVRPGEAVSAGFAATFSNTVLLGIPIIHRAYGDAALPYIYTIIGLHAPILLSFAMIVMELVRRDGADLGQTLKKMAHRVSTNPLLIGIVIGLLGNLSGLRLIEPAEAFTTMMAQAVLPAALFGLGGALNQYRVRENWMLALVLSFIKLFVQSAIVWVILVPILDVDHDIARYAVILAGMPAGINTYIFATMYKRSEGVAASAILIGTAASVVSVSIWLYVMAL